MNSKKKVVVLGGGACGLSAAWNLAEAGCEVVVIEKEPKLGGLCRTSEYKGYRFDLGGHRFISRDQNLIDRVSGLMGPQLLVSERKSIIRFRNKNFKYPLDLKDILLKMNPLLSTLCFASYVKSRIGDRIKRRSEKTLEDWLVGRYGRKLYDIFYKPYSTKLWGVGPKMISSEWASQRISLLNLSDVILRLLMLKKDRPRTYAIKYYYPQKGIGDIFNHIGRELERIGVEMRLQSEIKRINVSGSRVVSVEFASENQQHTVDCDFVVSTLPLPELIGILCPDAPDDVRTAASKLSFRSLRFMNILLDGIENISEYTWWYIQDGEYLATRLQEPKRRSMFSAPEGKTSVMLEIPCSFGDGVWNMEDNVLFERCLKDLRGVSLDLEKNVVDYFTTSVKHAYPVYTLDYRKNRDFLLDYLKSVPNLVSCGRQGLFDYIFMDDAMLMGFQAADVAVGKESVGAIYGRALDKDLLEVKSVVSGGDDG